MHCTRNVKDDIIWVGADDRRLAMFEGVYSIPSGVSYNAYVVLDEQTILFDTVDKAVGKVFFENVAHALNGRPLDYVVVQHMEPDHSATLMDLLCRYPEVKVVCNQKTRDMIAQFFGEELGERAHLVKEGDTLSTGRHAFQFVFAPMVHWPEVMFSFDKTDRVLFSADAFGTFGALGGALFADEVDFYNECMPEARRYYTNIIGKYGPQVQSALKKVSALSVSMICPLHGPVHRKDFGAYIEKYRQWSGYAPEETGVMLAYASIYGNTENAAAILACRLRDAGVKVRMFDVSTTPASEIVSASFRMSHLVFASSTYNAGIFITMEEVIRDLVLHNIQNRTVAFLENGTWAPASGKLMREMLCEQKDMTFLNETVTIRSALKPSQNGEIDALVAAIRATIPETPSAVPDAVDPAALFTLSYGLFVLTAREGERDNGCIINTVTQVSSMPKRISIAVSKDNLTHDMIQNTGVFNISVLTESSAFELYQRFGLQSGRQADKFADFAAFARSANGLTYVTQSVNALMSGKVHSAEDCGSHTLFVADLTEARKLSMEPSVTYEYYRQNIKPKPGAQAAKPAAAGKKKWLCTVCGYIYEGDELPPDFICPVCKHGAEVFVPLEEPAATAPKAEAAKPAEPAQTEPAKAAEPAKPATKKWLCTVCGYIYEGETLPPDFICPVCKHGAEVFVPLEEPAATAPKAEAAKPAEPAKSEPAKAAEPAKPATKKWLCTVCGYIYEGETLPPDFICPVCKHGAEVFVPLE